MFLISEYKLEITGLELKRYLGLKKVIIKEIFTLSLIYEENPNTFLLASNISTMHFTYIEL